MDVLLIVALSAVAWLGGLLLLDPHRSLKGTGRRVVTFFLLGTFSVVPAILLSVFVSPPLLTEEPSLRNLLLFVGVLAPIEELSKLLMFVLLATGNQSLREPSDGIYQAAAVGLAFAVLENFEYGILGGPEVALLRSFITPLRHMIYASIWGLVYAARKFGHARMTFRDRLLVLAAIAPASIVHGFSNFLADVGFLAQSLFGVAMIVTMILVLRGLRKSSPFVLRDLGRPRASLRVVQSALVHDPANPHLHFRAAHFRLRAGDPVCAEKHLDRFLAARPEHAYALGLKGAARVLAGCALEGEDLIERAEALMQPVTRRLFLRNVRRIIAPGRGRKPGGYGESMLRTWLTTLDMNRERIDPRPRPPAPAR